VREHLANFRQPDFHGRVPFAATTAWPYDPRFTSASFSPYGYCEGVRPDVAVLSLSGWMDGAGYMNGAISRFLTLGARGNPSHLLLGPWDHGTRINVSPWREQVEPQFNQLAAALRFFDHYLMGRPTGLEQEAPVHYFSLHDDRWRAAPAWPPIEASQRWHCAPGGALERTASAPGSDTYQVDFSTGTATRHATSASPRSTAATITSTGKAATIVILPLRRRRSPRPWSWPATPSSPWRSRPASPMRRCFVYLSEVEADGKTRYVTEGLLRALHRKETPLPAQLSNDLAVPQLLPPRRSAAGAGPARTHPHPACPDGLDLQQGSRIRVSIAGADADHCAQIPHGRPPHLTIHRGGDDGSAIELPLRPAR